MYHKYCASSTFSFMVADCTGLGILCTDCSCLPGEATLTLTGSCLSGKATPNTHPLTSQPRVNEAVQRHALDAVVHAHSHAHNAGCVPAACAQPATSS